MKDIKKWYGDDFNAKQPTCQMQEHKIFILRGFNGLRRVTYCIIYNYEGFQILRMVKTQIPTLGTLWSHGQIGRVIKELVVLWVSLQLISKVHSINKYEFRPSNTLKWTA